MDGSFQRNVNKCRLPNKKRGKSKGFPLLESGRRGSNPRPSAWKANALSTELLPQICGGQGWIRTTEGVSQQIYSLPHLATLVLAQQYFKKSGRRGSNPRPSAWKADALSTELLPQLCGRRWIRTTEGINQQIYSLPHLATLVFALSSLLSDSNQRPRDYKSRALAN